MTAISDALLAELSDDALRILAERLRPYLDEADTSRLLKPAEAAARLGVHPKTLTRAAAAGRVLGAERTGRSWRFRQTGLQIEPLTTRSIPDRPVTRRREPSRSTAAQAIRGRQQ